MTAHCVEPTPQGQYWQGANLAYILCTRSSSTAIKSYSPELIVSPVVPESSSDGDEANSEEELDCFKETLDQLLARMHVLIVGPGMGRDPKTAVACNCALKLAHRLSIPTIIDGVRGEGHVQHAPRAR